MEKRNQTSALGHAWDNGDVTQQPTASSEGVKTFTCTRCGKTKTESVPKLDRVYYSIEEAVAAGNAYLASLGYVQNYNARPSNSGWWVPEVMSGDIITMMGGQSWLNNLAVENCIYSVNNTSPNITYLTCYGYYDSTTDEYHIYVLEGGPV